MEASIASYLNMQFWIAPVKMMKHISLKCGINILFVWAFGFATLLHALFVTSVGYYLLHLLVGPCNYL